MYRHRLAALLVALVIVAAPVSAAPGAGPDELILYAFPAPVFIDYDTPRALMADFVKGTLDFTEKSETKHAIGHVFVRIKSGGDEVLTGQTTDGNEEEKVVVKKLEYGLGYLGTAFRGDLDGPAKLQRELDDRFEMGEMSYIRFLVSPATSARLMRFYREYRDRGVCRWWGEANRPRYGEGGACASLAAAFLEVGGLLENEYRDRWTVELKVPADLFGGPLLGRRVPMSEVLLENLITSRWARDGEPFVPCILWEPTRIHRWIEQNWKDETERSWGRFMPETHRNAHGLVIDCRALPTPNEPLWLDPVAEPNLQGRQPGSRVAVDFPDEAREMEAAMERQRDAMVRRGMIPAGFVR